MSTLQLLPQHADRIRDRISELGLDDFCTPILESACSAYGLIGVEQADSPEKGTTRFGGHPDLPAEFDTGELNDFEFVYQVNCADLPEGESLGLPADGLLSVFSNSDPYDGGKTLFFQTSDLIRHHMPDPMPDYIFSDVKPWKLKIANHVGFAGYGDELFNKIEDAGLSDEYEQLCCTEFSNVSGPCFGEILGRFSELNGDMREEAAEACGGKPAEWRSLWKIFSSFQSGLVISDFHLLHGMIRKRELQALIFSRMFSTESND